MPAEGFMAAEDLVAAEATGSSHQGNWQYGDKHVRHQ
jgi:hypothetical protein